MNFKNFEIILNNLKTSGINPELYLQQREAEVRQLIPWEVAPQTVLEYIDSIKPDASQSDDSVDKMFMEVRSLTDIETVKFALRFWQIIDDFNLQYIDAYERHYKQDKTIFEEVRPTVMLKLSNNLRNITSVLEAHLIQLQTQKDMATVSLSISPSMSPTKTISKNQAKPTIVTKPPMPPKKHDVVQDLLRNGRHDVNDTNEYYTKTDKQLVYQTSETTDSFHKYSTVVQMVEHFLQTTPKGDIPTLGGTDKILIAIAYDVFREFGVEPLFASEDLKPKNPRPMDSEYVKPIKRLQVKEDNQEQKEINVTPQLKQ